jgi:hypothetical protein
MGLANDIAGVFYKAAGFDQREAYGWKPSHSSRAVSERPGACVRRSSYNSSSSEPKRIEFDITELKFNGQSFSPKLEVSNLGLLSTTKKTMEQKGLPLSDFLADFIARNFDPNYDRSRLSSSGNNENDYRDLCRDLSRPLHDGTPLDIKSRVENAMSHYHRNLFRYNYINEDTAAIVLGLLKSTSRSSYILGLAKNITGSFEGMHPEVTNPKTYFSAKFSVDPETRRIQRATGTSKYDADWAFNHPAVWLALAKYYPSLIAEHILSAFKDGNCLSGLLEYHEFESCVDYDRSWCDRAPQRRLVSNMQHPRYTDRNYDGKRNEFIRQRTNKLQILIAATLNEIAVHGQPYLAQKCADSISKSGTWLPKGYKVGG